MDFANIYAQGFARVAARVLPVKLADPVANAASVIEDVKALSDDGVCLVAYPELSLTGCSCGDLFLQDALLGATEDAIVALVDASAELRPVIIVGAPVRADGRIYNCAVVIQGGQLQMIVPKTYPSRSDEQRWFTSGGDEVSFGGLQDHQAMWAPFGTAQTLETGITGLTVGIEIGDDMAAVAGATVLVKMDGSPAVVGRADTRKLLVQAASITGNAAVVFAGAGVGESTTDAAWDGASFVYELGDLLGESPRFTTGPTGTTVDVDLRRIQLARLRQGTQADSPAEMPQPTNDCCDGCCDGDDCCAGSAADDKVADLPSGDIGLRRPLARFPFVPDDAAALDACCFEVMHIQLTALARRLESIGPSTKVVIGVSGGLDSTNALLVAAGAMHRLRRPMSDILAFTMPGFATSEGTKSNAWRLMKAVGATAEEIDIRPAARQMLKDLGHPEDLYDVTFENIQAGLRADYLFRAANQRGGMVLGTGDLSEAALGWCTYGVGDHISHYNVNAGLPKTMMQYVIRWMIDQHMVGDADDVLRDILAQEISPELVPVKAGEQIQSTQSAVGPYPLNDFFLAHMLAGEAPSRIAYLAWQAWRDAEAGAWPPGTPGDQCVAYDLATIKAWLGKFYQRFFASQFKRSCSPDGPQVLSVSLGPRGGWAMPSDAKPDAWLAELADVPETI
ncbi:MAG: NAD(+) synthase [Propionibacteriaceae bacterium]|nr:NAD(+) synthase [Propionibacteriaceae bacterium]